MRSWIVPALLVIEWPFTVDTALVGPVQYLGPRQGRETKQQFDQTTESFTQQGLCRFYLSPNRGPKGLEICAPKCGDLVKKAQKAGDTTSVSCVTGGMNIPTHTDPDGNQYHPGKCVCDIPILEELVIDVLMALPAIAEIGCAILFNALDKVLEIGAMAIPGVGATMNVGMKAAVQAAKTVAENGQGASSFIGWFGKTCGKGKYVNMINKIFDPLSNVPDSVVPGLGCKSKKCPGRKKDPDDKSNGGQTPSTKGNDQPSSTNKLPPSTKDQPPPTKAQPPPNNTQPPPTTGQRPSTKDANDTPKHQTSSRPNPSSTACSAKTAPSCIRVCTTVEKYGGGTTTTCAAPSCQTVTKYSATATTTTKFTSAASASICEASCKECKAKRPRSTLPPGLSRLARRAFREPSDYRSLDHFVDEQTRLAGDKALHDSDRLEGGQTVGTSSAKIITFGNTAFNTAITQLWGCTGVLVMSDRAIWLAHYWEGPSFQSNERFNVDVIWITERGDGTNFPGLAQYAVRGGPFGPDAKWRQIVIFSSMDRDYPKPNTYKYGQKIDSLEATLRRIVPNTDIKRLYYQPPRFEKELFANKREGNVLIQYEPRQPSAAQTSQGQPCTVNIPNIRLYAEGRLAYRMGWPQNQNQDPQRQKRESKCNQGDKGLTLLAPRADGVNS
ncbi:hypothetical protein MMC16_001050 [Acarospora aff. strigata]|nr:hypothetical protein [Acarospora aff. strigata]